MVDQAAARRLAHTWWRAIADTSYVPMSTYAAQALLSDLVVELATALDADPFDPLVGTRAGTALVRYRFTNPVVVGNSAEVLGGLVGLVHRYPPDVYWSRLVALLGAFGQGYAASLQEWTLAEQEAIRRAVLAALRQVQDELYRQARHDPLTGLPNRTLLHERLRDGAADANDGDRVGLCFLDLDGFKAVNDRYGHGTGDRLLAAVAKQLQAAVKDEGCLVSRIGGDEFVAMVAPPADTESTTAAAEAMLAALSEPIEVDGHIVAVSASIGVVVLPVAGTRPEALLDAADIGLYRAKAGGRGQWLLQQHDISERPLP